MIKPCHKYPGDNGVGAKVVAKRKIKHKEVIQN